MPVFLDFKSFTTDSKSVFISLIIGMAHLHLLSTHRIDIHHIINDI